MDKVTRASRRDDFIGAMYSITHFYLPLPWYSKVLDKDEAIAYRQEYGEFFITVGTPNNGAPNKGIFPYLTGNLKSGK